MRRGLVRHWLAMNGALVVAGCGTSHATPGDTGIDAFDAMDAFIRSPDSHIQVDAALDAFAAVRCSASICAPGETCCLLDGRCVDPAADDCSLGAADAGQLDAGTLCTTHGDCDAGEFCALERIGCLGAGRCVRLDSFDCGGGTPRCGCDGQTYGDVCEALIAGVRVLPTPGPCGSDRYPASGREPDFPTLCGASDAWCDGTRCCAITGLCLPADCPDCCFAPRGEGRYPCATDAYCAQFRSGSAFCDGDSCTGPGGCVPIPPVSSCEGVFDPVCGCDGRTYSNRCLSQAAGVRTAHTGACE